MRLLIQRVKEASVTVNGTIIGSISKGFLVFLGIHKNDTLEDIPWLINKLMHLRVFEDDQGKMNLNIHDIRGELLIVSQFTLYANCQNGRRPDFISSASPSIAIPLYEAFIAEAQKHLRVSTGEFGADMEVALINDGPATFILEKA